MSVLFLGTCYSPELLGLGNAAVAPDGGGGSLHRDHHTATNVSESVSSLFLELLWLPQRRALFIFISLYPCQEISLQMAFIQVLHERC